MKKGSVLLFAFLVFFIALSASAKYYKFVIKRDYFVSAEISCDTETESCFVWDCDIDNDEDCDHTPYKYIYKYVGNTPYCDPYTEEECPELVCEEGEDDCEITFCSEETLGEEEYCF